MKKSERECCWWRKSVESASEKGDKSILEECIWNWVRFSEKDPTGQFSCSTCQKRAIELGRFCGVDFTDKDAAFETVQTRIKAGMIKCCGVIPLIDLEDPDKLILYEQAAGFKVHFQENLCFACSVKINGILVVLSNNGGISE